MIRGRRLLIYSHDSFGLGHLRRCRTIAHHLVARYKHLSVLILSGSPIIGSFDFGSRVDFVRVPGVIKLRNGEYTSLALHLDIDKTLEIRRSIIHHTAEVFEPDLFLVDKEPLGLRGEVRSTLEMMRERDVPCVLGLRDVLDEPTTLAEEWRRKDVRPALEQLYNEIWVYGLPEFADPLRDLPGREDISAKLRFTGYLRRELPMNPSPAPYLAGLEPGYVLVTTGGGGDGEELIDWVIAAYEHDRDLPLRALLLLGPFMPPAQRVAFLARIAGDPRLQAITFEAQVEPLFERAGAIVAMGGYNTFCEILSFAKPALVVPRMVPRLEQHLRAERAERLGLLRMLSADGGRDPARMAAALRALPSAPVAGADQRARLLCGLERISELAAPWLADPQGPADHLGYASEPMTRYA